jgi:hypothetical protein
MYSVVTRVTSALEPLPIQSRRWWNYISDSPIRLFVFVLVILFCLSLLEQIFTSFNISALPLLWQIVFFSSLFSLIIGLYGYFNFDVRSSRVRMRMPRNAAEMRAFMVRLRISGRAGDFDGNDYDMLNSLDEDIENPASGTPQEQIDNLPSYVFGSGGGESGVDEESRRDNNSPLSPGSASSDPNADQCVICLSGYSAGDNMRVLPCMHQYHAPCIDRWLRRHRTCPVCKQSVE